MSPAYRSAPPVPSRLSGSIAGLHRMPRRVLHEERVRRRDQQRKCDGDREHHNEGHAEADLPRVEYRASERSERKELDQRARGRDRRGSAPLAPAIKRDPCEDHQAGGERIALRALHVADHGQPRERERKGPPGAPAGDASRRSKP